MIDPKQAALTVVTEAVLVLEYESCRGATPADDLIEEAREMLLAARSLLTTVELPESALVEMDNPREFEAWHIARLEEHRQAGRQ